MLAGLRSLPGVRCTTPRGAFYVFADVRGLLGKRAGGRQLRDDVDVAGFLLDEARVAVVPGSAFSAPGFVRLSYAVADARIDEAITRMATAIATLS
jgi:aspartate aminotransferase